MKLRKLIEGQGIIDETSIVGSKPTHVITCDGTLGSRFTSKIERLRKQMTANDMKILQITHYQYNDNSHEVLAEFTVSTDHQNFTDFVDEHDIDPDMLFYVIKQYKKPKLKVISITK